MVDSQNIQIPLSLFQKTIEIFEYLNVLNYKFPIPYNFDEVLSEIRDKQQRLNLHAAFTNMVIAKDDVHKRHAYADYMKLKKKYS